MDGKRREQKELGAGIDWRSPARLLQQCCVPATNNALQSTPVDESGFAHWHKEC